MEEAALGIGETSRWNEPHPEESRQGREVYLGWYGSKTLQSGLAVLPSQSQSRALVSLYEENAAWITGSVHLSNLRREQDTFWIQLEANSYRDDIWLALYFAVLSVSAFFVDEDHASMVNMTVSQLHNLGRACFDAAIATIFRMDGITHPSMVMCQAVQTLGPAFHFTSNTKLHRSLVPIMTSHARTLNLHLLGKTSTRDIGKEQEIGRLVWWNIVEPDWTFLPYNRYCGEYSSGGLHTIEAYQIAISPRHFTTVLPNSAPSVPLTYRLVCFRAARVLCDLFGDLAFNQEPSYDAVIAASDQIHEIRKDIDHEHAGMVLEITLESGYKRA
jgi:hypothetical protein